MAIKAKIKRFWASFFMKSSQIRYFNRISIYLAGVFSPPYKGRKHLAYLCSKGYVSPSAKIHHNNIQFGKHVFIGDHVTIFQSKDGGHVSIGTESSLHANSIIEVGQRGSVSIGDHTHIQPMCQLSAYVGELVIGNNVQIAPRCAFYPYNHQVKLSDEISNQPLVSKSGIHIGDGAWLGYGVVVLDGVRIGKGAVIGASAVVSSDIPDNAIAAGAPAKVIKMRS